MVVIDLGWDIPETKQVAVDAETLAAIDRGIKDADEGRTVSLDEACKLIPLSASVKDRGQERALRFVVQPERH